MQKKNYHKHFSAPPPLQTSKKFRAPLFCHENYGLTHRKACKLNFGWKICNFFQGPPYKGQNKKFLGPPFYTRPPNKQMSVSEQSHTESCNLHDLYSCIDSRECFYALLNISLFWDTKFYHLSDDIGVLFCHFHFFLCPLWKGNPIFFCWFPVHWNFTSWVQTPGGYSTLSWVRMCGPKFRPPPYN